MNIHEHQKAPESHLLDTYDFGNGYMASAGYSPAAGLSENEDSEYGSRDTKPHCCLDIDNSAARINGSQWSRDVVMVKLIIYNVSHT